MRVTHRGVPGGATGTITCDGPVRDAARFWAHDPREACEALASTGHALAAGPGCRVTDGRTLRLVVSGTFGGRSFTHRQQRGGCPDADGWLAVNALIKPIAVPEKKSIDPATASTGRWLPMASGSDRYRGIPLDDHVGAG